MKHPAKLALLLAIVTTGGAHADSSGDDHHHFPTATPITHLVVIFNENISFDHYFGTYPIAQNNAGETPFFAAANTPRSINTLLTPLDTTNHFAPLKNLDLIHHNPNGPGGSGAAVNGVNAANPFRLAPSQAATVDQGHAPQAEQLAYDNGLLDRFPADTGNAGGSASLPPIPTPTSAAAATKGLVMGYYDGNTVTALWNYAQHFALNDNHYTSQFGPSSPGAIDLISGQSNGFAALQGVVDANGNLLHPSHEAADGAGGYTLVGDADPLGDVCSTAADQVSMAGRNIGDRLNVGGMTWGWFEGGFDLSIVNPNGSTGCARYTTPTVTPFAYFSTDYIPHHQPFQYYPSTRNLTHARPSSVAAIGHSFIPHTTTPEPANHQYDLEDFFAALSAGNLPAVSFLKAAAYQDAHAGNSDPIDEQHFLVRVINALQRSAEWPTTAVIIAYDDSDGWYDHQMPPIVNPSFDPSSTCSMGLAFAIVGSSKAARRRPRRSMAMPACRPTAGAAMAPACRCW